jgi:hypothetical protein
MSVVDMTFSVVIAPYPFDAVGSPLASFELASYCCVSLVE